MLIKIKGIYILKRYMAPNIYVQIYLSTINNNENYGVICDVIIHVYMSKVQIRINMSAATFILFYILVETSRIPSSSFFWNYAQIYIDILQ